MNATDATAQVASKHQRPGKGSRTSRSVAAGVEEWATYGPVSHNFSGLTLNAGASALKYCERHFGDAWLDHWLHRVTHLCSAQSSVRCRWARRRFDARAVCSSLRWLLQGW